MQSQQTLELRQRQQLTLTPALQQSIRFLQLSALELQQELSQAVLDNPMLDADTEYDIEEDIAVEGEGYQLTVDWSRSGRNRRNNRTFGDDNENVQGVASETLQEYLLAQLDASEIGVRDDALVRALVYELNEDGYLASKLPDIVVFLQRYVAVEESDVLEALVILQSMEPAGVGARTLGECLMLQLERLDARSGKHDAQVVACANTIVSQHLDVLATGNLQRLRQALGGNAHLLKAAHALILSLNPRPAQDWADNAASYVVPDVLVRKIGGRWRAMLNPTSVPRIRVHALYSELLDQAEGNRELRAQLQQAHNLVKGVHSRFDTILRVSQAIVDYQQDYFRLGRQAMRPLVLSDIAQQLGLHESTVSRATRFKYAQTPQGVIELREFFGSTLMTHDGVTTSNVAVQFMITRLVETESKIKPLSDSKIVRLLEQQGVQIARRTVAKYREEAGIESAMRRKTRYSLET